jgi:hypothetical protein
MPKFQPTSNFPICQILPFLSFLIRQFLDFGKTLAKPIVLTEEKLFRAQNLKFASRCALLLVKFWALGLRPWIFRPRARGSSRVAAPTQLLYM